MKNYYNFIITILCLSVFTVNSVNGQCTSPPPASTTIAESTEVCLTGSVVLSLGTTYNGSYTYQWQNSPNGGQFFDITGATSATLTTTQFGTRWYRCTVKCNGAGQPSNSSIVMVTSTGLPCSGTACIDAPATATVIADATAVCTGNTVLLSLSTEYTNGELFQWQYAGFNGFFINITGATADEYTATISNNYVYRAVITCSAGNLSTETEAVAVSVANQAPALAATAPQFCSASTVADLDLALNPTAGTTVTWYATATTDIPLAPTAALVSGNTYYASQGVEGCQSTARTAVEVTLEELELSPVMDIMACTSYTLPDIESGSYYSAPGGVGAIAVGTVIEESILIYVYAAAGSCTAEDSFEVTIAAAPDAPQGAEEQTVSVPVGTIATLADLDVTGSGVSWYATAEDAQEGTTPLDETTPLVTGATYYATQTLGFCASNDVLAVLVTVTLGTNDFNAVQFTYYPNPVNDVLNISAQAAITSVKVYNLLGQELLSKQVNATNAVLDMGNLTSGSYIVNVTANNQVKTFRIAKK